MTNFGHGRPTRKVFEDSGQRSKVSLKNLLQTLLFNPYPDVQLVGEFPHCLYWDPGSVWGRKGDPRPSFPHFPTPLRAESLLLSAVICKCILSYLGHRGKREGDCLLLMMFYLFILGCFMPQGNVAGLIWAGLAPSSYTEGKSPLTLSRRDPHAMPSILSFCMYWLTTYCLQDKERFWPGLCLTRLD